MPAKDFYHETVKTSLIKDGWTITPLPPRAFTLLWLIMPTASKRLIKGFSIVPTEHPGVYQFPEGQRTGLIVVHQLEKTESTLWLRILGRAGKQKKAIEELSSTH